MDDKHEVISGRAYALWEREGRPDGRHEEHWRRAEEEASAGKKPAGGKSRAKARGQVEGLEPSRAPGDQGSAD